MSQKRTLTTLLLAMALGACESGAGIQVPATAGSLPAISTISGPSALPPACQERQSEDFPQLVVDPRDGEHLSAVYYQDGTRAAVGATSSDGGRTWRRAPVSAATACSGGPAARSSVFNPLLGQGIDGRVYYGASYGKTTIFAADDAAGAWNQGVSPGNNDASENMNAIGDPWIAQKVHALWTHFESIPVVGLPAVSQLRTAISLDGARSFGAPTRVAAAAPGRIIINGRVVRASDAQLLACYDSIAAQDLPNAVTTTRTAFQVDCVRSADGLAWTAPVAAGDSVFLPLADPEGRTPAGADPAFVAGSAKFDLASGPDGLAIIVHADLDGDGTGRLQLMRSYDGGASWSGPLDAIVRPAAVFEPALAIGRDGTIGLFWYDWTSDVPGDEALSTDAWFAASRDGGMTWAVQHLAGPFDLRAAYQEGLAYDGGALGTYQDLAALSDGFGAAFTVGPPLAQDGKTDVVFARIRRR
jgi:hypothetical protein